MLNNRGCAAAWPMPMRVPPEKKNFGSAFARRDSFPRTLGPRETIWTRAKQTVWARRRIQQQAASACRYGQHRRGKEQSEGRVFWRVQATAPGEREELVRPDPVVSLGRHHRSRRPPAEDAALERQPSRRSGIMGLFSSDKSTNPAYILVEKVRQREISRFGRVRARGHHPAPPPFVRARPRLDPRALDVRRVASPPPGRSSASARRRRRARPGSQSKSRPGPPLPV